MRFSAVALVFCLAFVKFGAASNYCPDSPIFTWHSGAEEGFPIENVLINNDPCQDPNMVWLNDHLKPYSQFIMDMGCVDNFDTVAYRQIPFGPIPDKKHAGIGRFKIWASADQQDWWVVRQGIFPGYWPNADCADMSLYQVAIDDAPKRYIWVEGEDFWGDGGGLAYFNVFKSAGSQESSESQESDSDERRKKKKRRQ